MTTYQISEEIKALYALMSECDENGVCLHSDSDLEDFIKEIKQNKETKLDNLQDLKLSLINDTKYYDEKIEKLQTRKKALLADVERVKNLQLLLLDGEKCKTKEYTFYFMSSESVEIDSNVEASDFDSDYVKIKYDFDKTKIKTALKEGVIFDGINLVKKQSLAVK